MRTSFITVEGPQKSIDLQVPSDAPIKDLIPALLKICGPQPLDARLANPMLWALGIAKYNTPLPSNQSLQEAGVGNGMTLVLRGIAASPPDRGKLITAPNLLPAPDQSFTHQPTQSLQPDMVEPEKATDTFYIPVRDYPPRLPNEEIVISSPPQVAPTARGAAQWLQFLLPVFGGIGGSLFFLLYFVNGASGPLLLVVAIAVPLLTIVGSIATNLVQKWTAKKQRIYARKTYLDYLATLRVRLQEITELQRQVSERLYPVPTILAKNVTERIYLWERRAEDPDFLNVSIGQGPAPLCCPIRLGLSNDFMTQYEPELKTEAESLIAQYHHLDEEPAVIPLRMIGTLTITGKSTATRDLVRAMLCQIVAFHTPKEVRCIACFPAGAANEWNWLKWLPHTQRLRHVKATKQLAAEPYSLLADNASDFLEILETQVRPELELRRKLSEVQGADLEQYLLPHLIFIIDSFVLGSELAQTPELDELFRDAAKLGVTILCLVNERSQEPTGTQARIAISDRGWLSFAVTKFDGRRMTGITPNSANVQLCEHIARNLAVLTLANQEAQGDLSQDIRLLDLLNISAPEAIRPAKTWIAREKAAILRIPIGMREKGKALLLDLKEAAEKGDGPHGLVVGATGSGKSELLRTLVISQAILHDPSLVNFVFVDFKGGASFADLAALPHVAGMITNLENEPTLIDRMHASLLGELRRRQQILREAGNLDNIQQYRLLWQTRRNTMQPLPHLLLIVDEFAELLTNRPDFLELFVTIGRVGRSLGLHLLLATQRLEEGRLKGLESYLRYRICLRTFSAAESAAVLGKADAYYLPSAPGIGYIKIDANTPQRFKTALISMPYVPANQQVSASDFVREFTPTGRIVPCQSVVQSSPTAKIAETNQTEMDITIAHLAASGQGAVHQVWLPPLPKMLDLERIVGQAFTASSWQRPPLFGMLRVPIGLLDVPLEQAQVPLILDFGGAGGHLAIVGAPQSGKSMLLRTLITSFALTHSPRDVQIYCIDLGGGLLRPLEDLPHVGAVCTQADREKIRLLLRLMYKVIADRQVLFRDHHIESMAMYRNSRQKGELADFPFGDVFLVIDNLAQLQHDFEQIEAEITNIVATGLTYGVHIILASNRWPEIRPKLRDNMGTRLELRLNDPIESEVDKRKSAELPVGVPGRGLTKEKLQFQACLPGVGSNGRDNVSQQILTLLVEQAKVWRGQVASPVLMLPTQIKQREMLSTIKEAIKGVPLGLEEFRLDIASLDLFSAGPHLLILGDPECGKTNLLRLLISELMRRYSPEQVKIAAIECRSTTNFFHITNSEHFLTYGSMRMPASLKDSVDFLTSKLKERSLPTTFQSIKDLENAKTWSGPHYFLFVDDYDAIASSSGSALSPLRELIVQARDIGFHVVLTRTVSGVSSMSFEPLFKTLREMGGPGLIMSGDRQEGKLLHDQFAANQPPGRGYLVQRKQPPTLVQVALV